MSFKKCQKCDRPATHKFTRIVHGKARDYFFCEEHAAESSPLQQKASDAQMKLAQALAGLFGEGGQKVAEGQAGAAGMQCEQCGLSYQQYKKTMLLGCSQCYKTFERQLAHDLRRYHGTVRHSGKAPEPAGGSGADSLNLKDLEDRLALAIEDEDFEVAAQLRDQIREINSANKKKTDDE